METDFEKELSQKFNRRVIEPSANAWERVNLQRKRQPKKHTYIYWMAAAVLGIGLLFFEWQNGNPTAIRSVVTKDANPENGNKSQARPREEVKECGQKRSVDRFEFRFASPTPSANEEAIAYRKQETAIEQPIGILSQSVQQQKMAEVLVAVDKLIAAGKQPTADDIDSLIAQARRDIASGNGLSKQTDASALLKDSESELDENFRSGIFENLFKHKKIKIAFGGH